MARNLKYQLNYCVNFCFKEKIDKHSEKKNGKINSGKIFSYADRKNMIDFTANFANFMKKNHPKIKFAKDIKSEHIQEFINLKAKSCSDATIKSYISHSKKLEKIINKTYNAKVKFEVLAVPAKNNTKLRNSSMRNEDFEKIINTYSNPYNDTGAIALNIAARSGLRIEEISKLKVSDINIQERYINVVDGKGGRDRKVQIQERDIEYYKKLKDEIGEGRCITAQKNSISKNVNRHMKQAKIKEKYIDSCLHCVRKMYAQRRFDELREQGKSIVDAWGIVSTELGHSANREKLMKVYIKNIY